MHAWVMLGCGHCARVCAVPSRACVYGTRRLRSLASRRVPADAAEWRRQMEHPSGKSPERQPPSGDVRQLRIAVLGVPNSGKSRLVNALSGWPVCGVSRRAHTTRRTCTAVVTDASSSCQLVLHDTPGVVTAAEVQRYHLSPTLLADPAAAVRRADLVCVVHDVSDHRGRRGLIPKVQRLLFELPSRGTPCVLVLTKTDLLADKRRLLDLTALLTEDLPHAASENDEEAVSTAAVTDVQPSSALEGWRSEGVELAAGFVHPSDGDNNSDDGRPADAQTLRRHRQLVLDGHCDQLTEQQLMTLACGWRSWPLFRHVFSTSVVVHQDGGGVATVQQPPPRVRGVAQLRDFLVSMATAGEWRYDASVVTSQSPRRLTLNLLRSQLLEFLPARLPYEIECRVDEWSLSVSGSLAVQMSLVCRRAVDARLVVRRVRLIAQAVEQLMRDAFRRDVLLRLCVHPQVKPLSAEQRSEAMRRLDEAKIEQL